MVSGCGTVNGKQSADGEDPRILIANPPKISAGENAGKTPGRAHGKISSGVGGLPRENSAYRQNDHL
jgi:hypothetical protein